jgi:hypothetical protein
MFEMFLSISYNEIVFTFIITRGLHESIKNDS